MKRKKSKLAAFFSLNQHRKRWGAAKHTVRTEDILDMKARVIQAGEPVQTRGAEKALDTHLENLRQEFSGQSELLWHHAKLVVLMRRGFKEKETYRRFQELWQAESKFLCQNLNVRWLVSASDTMADHDPNPQTRATAMMVSLMANLVKMTESERFITDTDDSRADETRIAQVQTELVPLFEGMSCFTVGTDDTLRNMYWRLEPYFRNGPAGEILLMVWNKFQCGNTTFARMRAMHQRDRTKWWTDET